MPRPCQGFCSKHDTRFFSHNHLLYNSKVYNIRNESIKEDFPHISSCFPYIFQIHYTIQPGVDLFLLRNRRNKTAESSYSQTESGQHSKSRCGHLSKIAPLPSARGILFFAAGGIMYSIRAVVYAREKPDPFPGVFGFHEIWHLFALSGNKLHFMSMYGYIRYL